MKNEMRESKLSASTFNNIKRIFNILFLYNKWFLIGLILLSILTSIITIITTLLTQELINAIQLNNTSGGFITQILVFYLLMKFILIVSNNINNYLFTKYNDYLMMKLNILFQEKTGKLDFCDFENSIIYDMLQRAEQQIGVRPIALVKDVVSIISSIVSFVGSLIILTNWQIWSLLGFVLLPIFSYKYFAIINKYEYETVFKRTKIERKSWYIIYLLIKDYYVKEVRMLGITDYLINKLSKIKAIIYKQNNTFNRNRLKFNMIYQISNFIFSSCVVSYAIYETVLGKIFVGNLLTYINMTNRLETSITSITSSLFSMYTNSMYCEYILNFFDYIDSKTVNNNEKTKIKYINNIELKSVSFKYPNTQQYALKNISLKLNNKNIYALVGENGSGKTTLIKILCGIYSTYEGEILVDGVNLKNIDIESYQKALSVIFQDYNNYEFSIKENIGLGDLNNIDDLEKIKYTSELSGADCFIKKLKNNYNQQVGTWFENGVQLSGGQWQKLAISRCIFRDVGVYIFDEPTASLDPSAEYLFFKNFLNNFKEKMTIFVTHRFTNAVLANKIIVLKDGEIVESGTHQTLVENDNEYARLYKIQLGKLDYN